MYLLLQLARVKASLPVATPPLADCYENMLLPL
jgi:hypothetical protein